MNWRLWTWFDWLGAASLLAVLIAMAATPYMGSALIPWWLIYAPILLLLYWVLWLILRLRPGYFMLPLALLLSVRLVLNGISYEEVCRQDRPPLFKPLQLPASFRHVWFYDGSPPEGKASSQCDTVCLTLLTLRQVSFTEISLETATDRTPNKYKQRVRYDWQNPACVAWVDNHPDAHERMSRLGEGSSLYQNKYNYTEGELATIQAEWNKVKSCFIYENIYDFEATYLYTTSYNSEEHKIYKTKNRNLEPYELEPSESRVLFNDFDRTTSVLFEANGGVHDGLVGLAASSMMYQYRAFAIPAFDPLIGVNNVLFREPTTYPCRGRRMMLLGGAFEIFDLILNGLGEKGNEN